MPAAFANRAQPGGSMDHLGAINSCAVERYLLGHMPGSESESFERHFFECNVCASEIESGVLLEENLRAACVDDEVWPSKPVQSGWLGGLSRGRVAVTPALASAILGALLIYQSA